jgi:hypothetical protein
MLQMKTQNARKNVLFQSYLNNINNIRKKGGIFAPPVQKKLDFPETPPRRIPGARCRRSPSHGPFHRRAAISILAISPAFRLT